MASARMFMATALLAFFAVLVVNGQEKKDAKADDEKTLRNRARNLAAALGQLDKVKELLKQGADIQWRDPANNGKTPLVKAILGQRFETVKYLLENGADINYPDGSGRYPIHFC